MKATMLCRLVPLAVILIGCGDGGSGPGDVGDGEFEFTITGEVDRSVSGDAFFVAGEAGGDESLSIVLTADEEGFVLARQGMTLPATGSYNITTGIDAGPNDFFLAGFFRDGSTLSHLCESGSVDEGAGPVFGTVTITDSGEDLAGTFTATVGCLNYDTGDVIDATVTGAFDAKELEEGDFE